MAELILTDDEMNAVSLLDEWSDEAIAQSVRYCAAILGVPSDGGSENQAVFMHTCGQILVCICNKFNSANCKLILEGVTEADKKLGDWVITIEKR